MSIKKYGVLTSAFLLAILGFINSCFTQVNAASSSTVLPIAKGGTGNNSASGAATNILGTNFANYSGKLPASQLTGSVPIANGGTGGTNISQAKTNLQIPRIYKYRSWDNWGNTPYFKVMHGNMGASVIYEDHYQIIEVTGLGGVSSTDQKKFTIYLWPRSTKPVFIIYQTMGSCAASAVIGFYITNGDTFNLYLKAAIYTSSTNIQWTEYGSYMNPDSFVPEILWNKPSDAVDVSGAKCATYN
ncbi:MAG: hypothetical protein LBT99_00970 [Bifidobacteriaceae bacterium]|jgi:hypothetical protein|nr:hypothetical protein [Bifidobacteriaceae bacterium]